MEGQNGGRTGDECIACARVRLRETVIRFGRYGNLRCFHGPGQGGDNYRFAGVAYRVLDSSVPKGSTLSEGRTDHNLFVLLPNL